MGERRRRKQIIVDRRFQWKAVLIGLTYILAVGFCLAVPLFQMFSAIDTLLEGRNQQLTELYKRQQVYTIVSLGVFLLGIALAWIVFSLWRSHKVAGPLVQITRFVHTIRAGDFGARIQLRAKDEMKALAHALNDMAKGLEERDRTIKQSLMEQIAETKQIVDNSPSPQSNIDAVERLRTSIETCFETSPPPDLSTPGEETPQEDLVYTDS